MLRAPKPNYSKVEKLAVIKLIDNKILVLRASKGNAMVIMNTKEYKKKNWKNTRRTIQLCNK